MSLKDEIVAYYSDKGINVQQDNNSLITLLEQWYSGNVNGFHKYTEVIQKKVCEFERLTLNLPFKMVEEYASYVWNEKSSIVMENEKLNEVLQVLLKENNFEFAVQDFLALVEAFGGGATIEYVRNGKVYMDFIPTQKVMITDSHNGIVNGIIALSQKQNGDEYINHITRHYFNGEIYSIRHETFKSKDNSSLGDETSLDCIFNKEEIASMTIVVDQEKGIYEYGVDIATKVPYFQYFKTSIKNNYDYNSPYGLSRFANCIDDIKKSDMCYDASYIEIENGKSKIFMDSKLAEEHVGVDNNGNPIYTQYFSDKQRYIMMVNNLNGTLGENGEAIKIYNPQLRINEINEALSKAISLATFKFGLGTDYYEFKNKTLTATEVIATDSKLWRSVQRTQKVHKQNLQNIAISLLQLQALVDTNEEIDLSSEVVNINFDDSVVIDDETQKDRAIVLIEKGFMPKWKYLVQFENMSEEEAKQSVKEALEEEKQAQEIIYSTNDTSNGNEEQDND